VDKFLEIAGREKLGLSQYFPLWQRHFWDTQLRKGESYDEKWEYVVKNPVRAGLAKQSQDWPYQGELNALAW
jgi:REP element-mobilizing transposase RayT